jgi:WD40 repeat protein
MNAQLFSHMVDNLGFSPRQPPPPAYIKVRTKYKKQGEFNRVFLAQELRTSADKKAPPVVGSNPAPQSGAAASHNPIWATEFSKDGRFLAAGGQDRIVRVWAVISTPEERSMHEHDESGPSVEGGQATHLSAPVFQQKPLREYEGHTATVLDLSWSKVRSQAVLEDHIEKLLTELSRITSYYPRLWTRPYGSGTSVEPKTYVYSSTQISSHPYNFTLRTTDFS